MPTDTTELSFEDCRVLSAIFSVKRRRLQYMMDKFLTRKDWRSA